MSYDIANQLIKEKLIGQSYSTISVGDWWALYFSNNIWLVTQDIQSPNEEHLNQLLKLSTPSVLDGVDPEYISKSIVIHRNARKNVLDISLQEDSSLSLHFDNEWKITFPTSTEIVDWQWCLNESGRDPYSDFIIGCFFQNEVKINNKC